MELNQLRYFQALAEENNLTKTAEKLFLSPATLSVSLAKLEKEIGTPLFDRMGGRLYLNNQGKLFLDSVKESLTCLDKGLYDVKKSANQIDNTLSFATTNQTIWINMINEFLAENPEIRITHQEFKFSAGEQDFFINHFDFILTYTGRIQNKDMQSAELYNTDSILLCVQKNHPLANRKSIRIEELANESFLFPAGNQGIHKLYKQLCIDAGFTPNIRAEASFILLSALFQKGYGIAFVQKRAYTENLYPNSVAIPIENSNIGVELSHSIYWNSKKQFNSAAKKFKKFVTNYYK